MAEAEGRYTKALPKITEVTRPFWNGAKNRKLVIERCRSCGSRVWCPRPSCTECGSADLEWTPVTGRGTVYSFTVIRQVVGRGAAGFEKDIPYVVAWIDLDEGVRLCSNVVGCAVEKVEIGMRVEVVFEDATAEIALPKFKPVAA